MFAPFCINRWTMLLRPLWEATDKGLYPYIYICKCFSLYDINNEIDVQFCMNTFDHVISFFCNAYEYNILASVYLGHCTTFT